MTVKARIDVDVVFHDSAGSTFTVGSVSEHLMVSPGAATATAGTVGTSAVSLVGPTSVSTIAVKNTGSGVLRLAGAVNVPAGRLAVIPTTAAITVQAPSGNGSYTFVWVG